MKKLVIIGIQAVLCVAMVRLSYAQTPVYRPATDFTLVGKILPTPQVYHRVDTTQHPGMPRAVKRLVTNSAGLAIAFKTNSTAIAAKWCTGSRKTLPNMTAIAYEGLDLYIKKDGRWQFAGVGRPNGDCTEYTLVQNMAEGEKECLLYLPLYDETVSLEIGVDAGAMIQSSPDPFQKRILMYGSSILQGASASRPGMAYPARLSRDTGLNFLNLGLSGSAKMEKAVADMIATVSADAFVLDCVPNSSPEEIRDRTAYLVNTIRQHHPKVPILVIPRTVREHGAFDQEVGSWVKAQNEQIEQEISKLLRSGVKDLYLLSYDEGLGDDHEGTIDGGHPNDLGFDRMLQQLRPQFLSILKKYGLLPDGHSPLAPARVEQR
ncbi:SGNH/GDSL hydrolase family protein [Pontibacter mangrovi]|uniref:Hydrolase n=1 Tax=Pontibacter mangrovi TaxID=2589816 RepID=A0A501W5Y6_9BACT|nr:SGNH/GDSL hydrolase family protein [Pontibacter mangrovi]TPE41026.1 hydrolase [Pontibacter mangrovi]